MQWEYTDPPIRSIPASAGEPPRSLLVGAASQVYPRECGGTISVIYSSCFARGLSPRVRGNLANHSNDTLWHGSIPASAGEPPTSRRTPWTSWVYPRECGGTRSFVH